MGISAAPQANTAMARSETDVRGREMLTSPSLLPRTRRRPDSVSP